MKATADTQLSHERKREVQQHLGHLDALRGFAVLGVIAIHTGQVFHNSWYEYINNPGMRGVQLFFVVSAYTLLLSAQRRAREPRPVLSFFVRRYFRLAPLYYPFIFLATLTVPDLRALGWWHTLPAFFFLHNFLPKYYYAGTYGGWSLGVEALFYACFPLLVRYITTLKRAVISFVVMGLISTFVWHVAAHIDEAYFAYWSYFSFTVELPVFLFGFVAFFLWRDYLSLLVGKPDAKWISACLLGLAVISFINIVPINPQITMFSSIFCVPLLLSVSLYPWRVLVNRITILLGKLSYSMYLIHGAIIWTVLPPVVARHSWLVNQPHAVRWNIVAWVCVSSVSALLAWLTYTFIEEPGIVLGRRVVRWIQKRSVRSANSGMPPLTSLRDTPDAQF